MLKFAYLTAALMLAPAPALAQIVFQDAPVVATPAKGAPMTDVDKVECRTQDTIGSRLDAHKVCLTKQQWWEFEQENKRKVHDMQDLTPAPPSH